MKLLRPLLTGAFTMAGLALLAGCVASSAVKVVTAPVRVVGKAADLATTSRSERDENRGRSLRERQERLRELQRDDRKLFRRCADGKRKACRQREANQAEMQRLRRSIPEDSW